MSLQDLHSKVLLEKGDVTLKMANGATVAATYSGTCRIVLPSGHVFVGMIQLLCVFAFLRYGIYYMLGAYISF